MKMKNNCAISLAVISITGLLLSSCAKEFDPASYAPAFEIGGFSATDEIKPTNLVGYWAFDSDLNNSVTSTAATNNKTTFVNGFKGKATNFNVADKSYLTIEPTAAITSGLGSFTFSFWVNPVFTDANSDGGIDGAIGLLSLSNTKNFWGNINCFIENGSNPTSAFIKIQVTSGTSELWIEKPGITNLFGNWTNHTVTFDAATSQITYYINGSTAVAPKTVPWTGAANFTNSGAWVLGCVQFQTTPSLTAATGNQDWASYLTGNMDEVRIYNAALTANEVNALVILQGKGK